VEQEYIILGGGESGFGAARLAHAHGLPVFLSDRGAIDESRKVRLQEAGIPFEEGRHSEERILQAREVIKSPGIPDKAPLIRSLRERGVPVISEIEFAARYTRGKLIGITGTNGKTTTTLLTHHILSKAGMDVGIAGNIGESWAGKLVEEDHDWWVLEISSFQLDNMYQTRLNIAVLLNISEDHLDRYDNRMEGYIASKFRILQNQTEEDHFVYFADDDHIVGELAQRSVPSAQHPFSLETPVTNGAHYESQEIKFTIKPAFTMSIQELALQGRHNANNTMASGITARILEIRKEIIRDSLSDFQNVAHRLEHVITLSGVDYINDSKATNVNSTWYALESMSKPTVWIVGGVDKGNDYDQLEGLVLDKVKAVIALGKDNSKVRAAFEGKVESYMEAEHMAEAVSLAYRTAAKGDSVLLSPACASFDLFENYEDRGDQFKQAVRSL